MLRRIEVVIEHCSQAVSRDGGCDADGSRDVESLHPNPIIVLVCSHKLVFEEAFVNCTTADSGTSVHSGQPNDFRWNVPLTASSQPTE